MSFTSAFELFMHAKGGSEAEVYVSKKPMFPASSDFNPGIIFLYAWG